MDEDQGKGIGEYIAGLKRRKNKILLTAGTLFLLTAVVALVLPPVYRSTATILIEEQEIPPELVRSTITSFADQRIQVISQQVMTRANLMQIVERYNLYPRQRRHETNEEILARMREDIRLDIVNADVIDRRSGNKTTATIAFTLSYDGETREGAQKVANELTSLYLNENLKTRQEKAAETSSFLSEEVRRLSQHISDTESKLAAFKAQNVGRLPELVGLNMQLRDRTDSELLETERQISVLQERKIYLEGQLALIKPNSPMISAGGERILDSSERLKALEAQYASLSGVYSDQHPDIIKMQREISALRKETGDDSLAEQQKQLTRLRAELATAREKYSDDHPDIIKLKRSIASLEKAVLAPRAAVKETEKPENPAYIALQSQLRAAEKELQTLQTKRNDLKAKMATYEARIEQTPQVERVYLDLNRDHENSLRRYQELKAKQMEAEVAQELEKDSKGERFSLIDPPQYPEKPHSPNRPAILLLGLLLSIGGGLGYGAILESLDRSVKSSKELLSLGVAPLLATVPYLVNDAERSHKRKTRAVVATSGLAMLVVLVVLIHMLWMPLDVLWYSILRRLSV